MKGSCIIIGEDVDCSISEKLALESFVYVRCGSCMLNQKTGFSGNSQIGMNQKDNKNNMKALRNSGYRYLKTIGLGAYVSDNAITLSLVNRENIIWNESFTIIPSRIARLISLLSLT